MNKRSMKIGIQLWQLLNELESDNDLYTTLADLGYDSVEPCVMLGNFQSEFKALWLPEKLNEKIRKIEKANLSVRSCNMFSSSPWSINDIENVVDIAKRFKLEGISVRCPNDADIAAYRQYADIYMHMAARLEKIGCTVMLHPDTKSCMYKIDGISAYEWLLDHCSALGLQLDTGVLSYCGISCKYIIGKYRSRIASVHFKDVLASASDDVSFEDACTPLSNGIVPLFDYFTVSRADGIPMIIDSDKTSFPIMQEAENAVELINAYKNKRSCKRSLLKLVDVDTWEERTVAAFEKIIEAPFFSFDGEIIYYNADDGKMYGFSIPDSTEQKLNIGKLSCCNNDHVLSPDTKTLGISNVSIECGAYRSRVYSVNTETGESKRLTSGDIDFLHGWSADGEIAWCAYKNADRNEINRRRKPDGSPAYYDVDIYTKRLPDGNETRLSYGTGYNDGPEFDPIDGSIWFNSTRDGLMQIYNMDRSGEKLRRVATTSHNDWFPHVSPDGQRIVFLAYQSNEIQPYEHLPEFKVSIYIINRDGSQLQKVNEFYGGQGSMNVNSWSPDGKHFAYISYE